MQAKILQLEIGTPISECTSYPTGRSLDDVSDALYWKYQAEKANKCVEGIQQRMDKLVNDIIGHRFNTMLLQVEPYWKVYNGTIKTLREHERLKARLHEVLNNVDAMTPGEKTEVTAYMENHVKFEDTLRRDLKELDDEKPIGMPSVYKEGEVISLEDLQKELINVKDWALSEIDRSKDMAPTINQMIFKYLSQGDELKK